MASVIVPRSLAQELPRDSKLPYWLNYPASVGSEDEEESQQDTPETQYEYDGSQSPIIRYGTLSPEMQILHGRRSFDPNDKRPVEVFAASDTICESQDPDDSLPILNYKPVDIAVHMQPYTQSTPHPQAPPSSAPPTHLSVSSVHFSPQQRIETEVELVNIEIELLEGNLKTLKRKHDFDIELLEGNIGALKKKRNALMHLK